MSSFLATAGHDALSALPHPPARGSGPTLSSGEAGELSDDTLALSIIVELASPPWVVNRPEVAVAERPFPLMCCLPLVNRHGHAPSRTKGDTGQGEDILRADKREAELWKDCRQNHRDLLHGKALADTDAGSEAERNEGPPGNSVSMLRQEAIWAKSIQSLAKAVDDGARPKAR